MIEVRSVKKYYGSFLAVDEVSFDVRPGEIVAFVGPNGAGKSTVMKMIATYLQPDAGSISVNGRDVVKDSIEVRGALGYMPEKSISYEGMRVDRFLRFAGEARGLSGARLKENFGRVVGSCGLESVLHKRVGECSKGYQRRVAMAMSMIHDPGVLLMDEPTHGLDPLQVLALRDFLVGLKKDKAILFSSHIFQEVVAICDRVLIINNARLLADGAVVDVARDAGMPQVAGCTVEAPFEPLRKALAGLRHGALKDFDEAGSDAAHVEIEITGADLKNEIETLCAGENWPLKSYVEQQLDLEKVFAEIVKKSNEETLV